MARVPVLSAEAVKEQLDRISRSREFQKSARMQRFLRFAVQSVLTGKERELKEYTIALEVFDRPPDFNQRTDPVVRNEARRLRKKLEIYYSVEGAQDPILIQLPRGGYVPQICERPGGENASLPGTTSDTLDQTPPSITKNRFSRYLRQPYATLILIVVAAIAIVAMFRLRLHRQEGGLQPIHSVAVLPFQNRTNDPEIDLLSDGIADEVLNALAYIPDLKVVARTSAAQFKSSGTDVQEIGKKLGVEALLEGSVRSSQGKLRIIPRLVEVKSGYQLWSQSYEFRTRNLFGIQDAIAHAVAERLGQKWNAPVRSPASDEAYQAYILGRQFVVELRERTTPSTKAIAALERAVALDPNNADAWASLANAYGISTELGFVPAAEGTGKAIRFGQRALEINPNSALALANKGAELAVLHHDWSGADALFRHALETKPSDSFIHEMYAGCVLWSTGQLKEAQNHLEKAVELDPLNATPHLSLALTLYFRHRYKDAIRIGEEALALNPTSQAIASNLLRPLVIAGRIDRISELMDRFWRTDPLRSYVLAMRAYAAGDLTTARRYAHIALKADKDQDDRTNLYAVLHDEPDMIQTFESVSTPGFTPIDGALLDPIYDSYRSTPEFQALMKRLVAPR